MKRPVLAFIANSSSSMTMPSRGNARLEFTAKTTSHWFRPTNRDLGLATAAVILAARIEEYTP
jgi:hypothetical protein